MIILEKIQFQFFFENFMCLLSFKKYTIPPGRKKYHDSRKIKQRVHFMKHHAYEWFFNSIHSLPLAYAWKKTFLKFFNF